MLIVFEGTFNFEQKSAVSQFVAKRKFDEDSLAEFTRNRMYYLKVKDDLVTAIIK